MHRGGCHCGNVRFTMGPPRRHALCHCADCRRHAGAPLVGWAIVPSDTLVVTGSPKVYASSDEGRRHFCPECGTGLFYTNAALFPGETDVQVAALDDPQAIPPDLQVQVAERIPWMAELAAVPEFDRFPD